MIVEKGMTVQFSRGEFADEEVTVVYDVVELFDTSEAVKSMVKDGYDLDYPELWLVDRGYIVKRKNHVHFDLGVSYLEDSESDFK